MDELEGEVARHLASKVDGWSPEPSALAPRKGSPLQLAGIVLLVLAVIGGGTALGLTTGHSGHGKAAAIVPADGSPSPDPTASPSCDDSGPELVGCLGPTPSPSAPEGPSPSPSAAVLPPPSESPDPSPPPTTEPSPSPSPSECGPDDVDLTITGLDSTYEQTRLITFTAAVRYLHTCVSRGSGSAVIVTSSGGPVADRCQTSEPQPCPDPVPGGKVVAKGHVDTYDSDWSQVSSTDAAGHKTWAPAGGYGARLEAEGKKTTHLFTVTAVPLCGFGGGPVNLQLTADKHDYAPGDTVTLTGVGKPMRTSCGLQLNVPAFQAYQQRESGAVIWSECQVGQPDVAPAAPCPAPPSDKDPVVVGQGDVAPVGYAPDGSLLWSMTKMWTIPLDTPAYDDNLVIWYPYNVAFGGSSAGGFLGAADISIS